MIGRPLALLPPRSGPLAAVRITRTFQVVFGAFVVLAALERLTDVAVPIPLSAYVGLVALFHFPGTAPLALALAEAGAVLVGGSIESGRMPLDARLAEPILFSCVAVLALGQLLRRQWRRDVAAAAGQG